MAIDFDALDKKVDFKQLSEDIKDAAENGGTGNYKELPKGEYVVRFESLEIGETKDGRPMLKAMARVQCACDDDYDIESRNEDAKEFFEEYNGQKYPCIFMNRVLYGTKNDGNMIASAVGWLNCLEAETTAKFESYKQFNDCVLDIFEEIENEVEYHVLYDPKAFNTITIKDAFDI